jgi:acetyl-CoA carboxylase carboxyl transferase subunit alpha
MTADDLAELGVIDQIVSEPLGGAHREPRAVYDQVGKALTNQLFELLDVQAEQLLTQRDQKYRKIGAETGLGS